jgi:hypothetical protein
VLSTQAVAYDNSFGRGLANGGDKMVSGKGLIGSISVSPDIARVSKPVKAV